MAQAKLGDQVKVHYKGTLEDGAVFDTSENMDPLEFTLGEGDVIPGFENAVLGMNEGESKTVSVPPDEAYGDSDEELILTVPRSDLPSQIVPEIGMVLKATADDGSVSHIIVSEMDEESVTLDGNHPLAGQVLNFEIQLVEIVQ
ncbi:MAG: peptidylprolyl isomerase [Candidatus Omnitrophica bacterium]|nr:peptidylprolyl isomerase [Candidatus Omnitrophota bacterium]